MIATLAARNLNENVGSDGVCVRRESGVRWSVCVGIFSRNLAPVAVVMFLHSVYFIKKFGKCRTFKAICKIMLQ
jgi:hypothetical protein